MASILSYAGFEIETKEDKHKLRKIINDDKQPKDIRKLAVYIGLSYQLIAFSKAEQVLREIEDFEDLDSVFEKFLKEFWYREDMKTYPLQEFHICPLCQNPLQKVELQYYSQPVVSKKCNQEHFEQWLNPRGHIVEVNNKEFFISQKHNVDQWNSFVNYVESIGGKIAIEKDSSSN